MRNDNVRILVIAIAFVLAFGAVARADDYGPKRDVRAVRAALPVLMAARVRALGTAVQSIHADDVVINDKEAVADWSAGIQGGIVGFVRRYGLWWVSGQVDRDEPEPAGEIYWYSDPPGALPTCQSSGAFEAAPDYLVRELKLGTATLSLAQTHIAAIAQDAARESAWRKLHPGGLIPYGIQRDCFTVGNKPTYADTSAGYRVELTLPSPENLDIAHFTGRAPTLAEFSGAGSVYFFSFNIGGDAAVRVTGAALDVWCPFVLDPHARYTLTLTDANPEIGPLVGALRDNTLHFELPPFTATPSSSVMGKLDGY